MTPEDIKERLKERGWTQADLAEKLGVHPGTIKNLLSGQRPITEQLSRHIDYVLGTAREAVLVYRVDVPTHKVEELTAGRGCVTEADYREALAAVLKHNLQVLAEVGAQLEWTPEQRAALGISTPAPAAGGYAAAHEPFA